MKRIIINTPYWLKTYNYPMFIWKIEHKLISLVGNSVSIGYFYPKAYYEEDIVIQGRKDLK